MQYPLRVDLFEMDEEFAEPTTRFRLEGDSVRDFETAAQLEWLETDELGGYAAGTVNLCPTRRYHGLLVAPTESQVERHVFCSRFEESVHRGDDVWPLSVARYDDEMIAPEGHRALVSFELRPWPTWEYEIEGVRVRRELCMVRGKRVTLVRWSLVDESDDAGFELELRPLLPYRAADSLTMENDVLDASMRVSRRGFSCAPYAGLPRLEVTTAPDPLRIETDGVWYHGIWYERDRERGYDHQESQFSPGTMRFVLEGGEGVVVALGLDDAVDDPALLWRRESNARAFESEPIGNDVRGACELAARSFLHRAPAPSGLQRPAVTAGFPWFLEWGRDTFIALPGLTLARGQVEQCSDALSGVLEYLDRGLIPNIFGRDLEDSQYGSVDAALWFARCVRLFERGGGTRRFVIENYRSALVEIADAYFAGTDLGLEVDEGGLLRAGRETLNATWMDAQTDAGPVTPRAGFAVEVQALWVHLLAHLEELFKDSGIRREKRRFREAHELARTTFRERFWLDKERRLADVWTDADGPDKSIRPNMVLAAALEFSPLTRPERRAIVECAERELLTPRGLRTLAPSDPSYRGQYRGGPTERDEAYHQGTVWPWLLGFYVEASLRAGRTSRRHLSSMRAMLDGFSEELSAHGLGYVSEVFDGDAPHKGGGTFAQAWSTSELLRAYAMLEKGGA